MVLHTSGGKGGSGRGGGSNGTGAGIGEVISFKLSEFIYTENTVPKKQQRTNWKTFCSNVKEAFTSRQITRAWQMKRNYRAVQRKFTPQILPSGLIKQPVLSYIYFSRSWLNFPMNQPDFSLSGLRKQRLLLLNLGLCFMSSSRAIHFSQVSTRKYNENSTQREKIIPEIHLKMLRLFTHLNNYQITKVSFSTRTFPLSFSFSFNYPRVHRSGERQTPSHLYFFASRLS